MIYNFKFCYCNLLTYYVYVWIGLMRFVQIKCNSRVNSNFFIDFNF